MTHASITAQDVVDALGRSDRAPAGSAEYGTFAPFIGQLVEIVGEDRLNDQVGLGNLCEVTGQFVRSLAYNAEFISSLGLEGPLVSQVFIDLEGQLNAMAKDPEATLAQLGVTETEALQMDELGLNEPAKELLRKGRLTFAALLRTSPEVFIPRR